MLTAFSGSVPTPGAVSVIPVQVHPHNRSHIQEAYQNLPHLSRAILSQSSDGYPLPNQTPKFQQVSPERFNQHLKSLNQDTDRGGLLNKRNGHGWGWGEVSEGGWHSNKNSPALSALALLGFMFFLNLIQTSLQNNRQMLAAAALNTTTAAAMAGRNSRVKRGLDYLKSDFNKTRSVYTGYGLMQLQGNETRYQLAQSKTSFTDPPFKLRNFGLSSGNVKRKTSTAVENFKETSLECFQFIACMLGRAIYGNLDTTTGMMFRMLGNSVIPKIPKSTWTGRLMRAFNKGWRTNQDCETTFAKCGLIKLFNFNTTITRMRKKKSFEK